MSNLSQERRAGNRISPVAPNRFGVNYRGERAGSNNRSSSLNNRIPKVNNYTQVMKRISPARADANANAADGDDRNRVFDRLYGRSKPAMAAKSLSRDRNLSNGPKASQGPPKATVPR